MVEGDSWRELSGEPVSCQHIQRAPECRRQSWGGVRGPVGPIARGLLAPVYELLTVYLSTSGSIPPPPLLQNKDVVPANRNDDY